MSGELDLLEKGYAKEKVTVMRKDVNLYGKNLTTELPGSTRVVEITANKDKANNLTVIGILKECGSKSAGLVNH